jgi:hypothetical protein
MKKKMATADDPYLARMTQANIRIAEELHESMKELRLARRWMMRSDVRLCVLYQEAVEKYVEAKPQQELLREYRERTTKRPLAGRR